MNAYAIRLILIIGLIIGASYLAHSMGGKMADHASRIDSAVNAAVTGV